MKNINLIVVLIISTIYNCQSQISLVKAFDSNEYICSYSHFEGVNLYATFNSSTNEIKIYNQDHILEKSLTYRTNENLNTVLIYGLSKDVFNRDDKIEFLIQSINGLGESKMQLINDQNLVVQDFSNAVLIRTIGNKNYLIETAYESITDSDLKQVRASRTDKLYSIDGKFRKFIF